MKTICPWCGKELDLKMLTVAEDNTYIADCEYCKNEINFDPVDLLTYRQKVSIYYEIDDDFCTEDIAYCLIDFGCDEGEAKKIAPKIVETFEDILSNNEGYFDHYRQSVNEAIKECLIFDNKIPVLKERGDN